MHELHITLLSAAAATLIAILLSARCGATRGKEKILHGDGGNPVMMRRMRAHANFVEYTPLALILIAALELAGQAAVRDAWAKKDLGTFADEFTAEVEPHGRSAVVVVHGERRVRHAAAPAGAVIDESFPRFLRRTRRLRKWPVAGLNLLGIAGRPPAR